MEPEHEATDIEKLKNCVSGTERVLPSSPNWYCSKIIDANAQGILIFAARSAIYLFDTTENRCKYISHFQGHDERIVGISMCKTSDGGPLKAVSAAEDGKVKVWDLLSRISTTEHSLHKGKPTACHWSPLDSNLVASGDEKGYVVIFNVATQSAWFWHPDPGHSNVHSLAFSPTDCTHLAVGFKTGAVLVLSVAKKSQVIARLRGHSDEVQSIAWCPVIASSDGDVEDCAGAESCPEKSLIASSGKDKTIRVWNVKTSQCECVIQVSQTHGYRNRSGEDLYKARVWTSVAWPQCLGINRLISSGMNGELFLWDFSNVRKPSKEVFSAGDLCHNRVVFQIVDCGSTLFSTSMDRQLILWDINTKTSLSAVSGLGGFVYCLAFSPHHSDRLAIGTGENLVKLANLNQSAGYSCNVKSYWQGIKSKVTALSWHPERENLLGFGTEDGSVGVLDVLSSKPTTLSHTYHRGTVYTVTWGLQVYAATSENDAENREENKNLQDDTKANVSGQKFSLYSVGDGLVYQHSFSAQQKARDIASIIKSSNTIQGLKVHRCDMAWSGDFALVAIGNSDGSVNVYRPPHLALLCTLRVHGNFLINCIKWHPMYTSDSSSLSSLRYCIASASKDSVVLVVNLEQIIGSESSRSENSELIVTEPFRRLLGHSDRVTSLAWSSFSTGHLVSVSYDGTAQVWDVCAGTPVANFCGHLGRLLCVEWSASDADVIFTGDDDYCLMEWRVSKQSQGGSSTRRRVRKKTKRRDGANKTADMSEGVQPAALMLAELANKSPESTSADVVDSFPLVETAVFTHDDRLELQQLLNEKRKSLLLESTGNVQSGRVVASYDDLLDANIAATAEEELSENVKCLSVSDTVSLKGTGKESYRRKRRHVKSLFPRSTPADSNGIAAGQEDCLSLARMRTSEDQRLSAERSHLGCYVDRRNTLALCEVEDSHHLERESYDQLMCIAAMKGSSETALRAAAKGAYLNEYMLSLAASVSLELWEELCESYATQLNNEGLYHKAATYLLAVDKVYEAIDLFKENGLYKEAVCLARLRLPAGNNLLPKLLASWAERLCEECNFEQAAKCWISAGDIAAAASCLAKRPHRHSLLAAIRIAETAANEPQLAAMYVQKYIQEGLVLCDWEGVYNLLSVGTDYRDMSLVASTYMSLAKDLSESGAASDLCDTLPPEFTEQNKTISPRNENEAASSQSDKESVCLLKPVLVHGKPFLVHLLQNWQQTWKLDLSAESLPLLYDRLTQLLQTKQHQTGSRHVVLEASIVLVLAMIQLQLRELDLAAGWLLYMLTLVRSSCLAADVLVRLLRLIFPTGVSYLHEFTNHRFHDSSVQYSNDDIGFRYRCLESFYALYALRHVAECLVKETNPDVKSAASFLNCELDDISADKLHAFADRLLIEEGLDLYRILERYAQVRKWLQGIDGLKKDDVQRSNGTCENSADNNSIASESRIKPAMENGIGNMFAKFSVDEVLPLVQTDAHMSQHLSNFFISLLKKTPASTPDAELLPSDFDCGDASVAEGRVEFSREDLVKERQKMEERLSRMLEGWTLRVHPLEACMVLLNVCSGLMRFNANKDLQGNTASNVHVDVPERSNVNSEVSDGLQSVVNAGDSEAAMSSEIVLCENSKSGLGVDYEELARRVKDWAVKRAYSVVWKARFEEGTL